MKNPTNQCTRTAGRGIALILFFGLFGCGGRDAANGTDSWDQRLARKLVPRWQAAQDELRQIDDGLKRLPEIPVEDFGGTGGLAMFFNTAMASGVEPERIIEVRWNKAVPVDLVALVPARKYDVTGLIMDYGLPEDFSVELVGDAGTTVYSVATERNVRSRPVRNGYPFVYELPNPVVATGVRINVSRLHQEESEEGSLHVLAFAEVFSLSGGRNMAKNAEVSVSYPLQNFFHWHWRNSFLVDGQTSLGLPVVPQPGIEEIGWLSKSRSQDDMPAWVMVDLGQRARFNGLRLHPARRPSLGNLPGFGFPLRFRVDVSDSGSPGSFKTVHNRAGDIDNPGFNPVVLEFPAVQARFVRFEATKLWKPFASYPAFLALSEMEILNGTENIALGAPVTSSDQIGQVQAHRNLMWSEQALTDGLGPMGALAPTKAWLMGLGTRLRLETQAEQLHAEMAAIAASVRHWVFGVLMVLGGCGIFLSVLFPIRFRSLRRREILRIRERIAGDLHDEVGSNLGGIQLFSDLARQQLPESTELAAVQELAAETVAAVRDIVWLLRPNEENRICLAEHLKETGAILLDALEWTFEVDDALRYYAVADERARDLMLFFREALHNLLRHSQARTVAIRLSRQDGMLTLCISDDGCGMSPEVLERPSTLQALRHRAKRLCGRLEVVSKTGEGTTVTLILKDRF